MDVNALPVPVEVAIVAAFVGNAAIGAMLLGMADPQGPWHRWPRSLAEFLSRWLALEFWPVVLVVQLATAASGSRDDD